MFHANDGLFFDRNDDGSVTVSVADGFGADPRESVTVDPGTWASAVASVSHRGEDGPTWREALRFHQGDEAAAPFDPDGEPGADR